jgi:hypothetical protein
MQVHHTRQCCGKPHAVCDAAVTIQTHQFISLRDIM